MPDVLADIQRLLDMEKELVEMGIRIKPMIPKSSDPYEPTQVAWIFIGGAAGSCRQGARYLRNAVKSAMGGE